MKIALLPARYASSRLPGKPLLAETGKPLIQHAHEAAEAIGCFDRVVVATDDARIEQAVLDFGGEVVMTAVDHPNGTSRLAEAADVLGLPDDALIVNVQGDEPEIEAEPVLQLIALMDAQPDLPMGTVGCALAGDQDATDPNLVKVVPSQVGTALYFSRAPIPWDRDAGGPGVCLKHLGLYAYRRHFLRTYVGLSETPLEVQEKLEQLRVLEHGHAIGLVEAPSSPPGIDTAAQYAAFVARFSNRE